MILFVTETGRRGVIDGGGRPKLLTPEQYAALASVASFQGVYDQPVDDAVIDELFRAYGVCIPHPEPVNTMAAPVEIAYGADEVDPMEAPPSVDYSRACGAFWMNSFGSHGPCAMALGHDGPHQGRYHT